MNIAEQLVNTIIACLARSSSRELPTLIEACQLVGLIVGISFKKPATDEIEQLLRSAVGRQFVWHSLVEALNGNPILEQRYIGLIAGLSECVEKHR